MNIAAAVVVIGKKDRRPKRPMETLTSVPSASDQFTSLIDLMQDSTDWGNEGPGYWMRLTPRRNGPCGIRHASLRASTSR